MQFVVKFFFVCFDFFVAFFGVEFVFFHNEVGNSRGGGVKEAT